MNILANLNINFLGKTKYAIILSVVLLAISVYSLSTKWLNLGLDFTGGVTIELQSDAAIDTDEIRNVLQNNGFADAVVQLYGGENDFQIKLPPNDADSQDYAQQVIETLEANGHDYTLLSQSLVGPQFGQELVDRGALSLFLALAGIMIYVSLRFQWKLALGSVVALAHDLIITLGFFSLLQIEFNLTVLAALLAVLGYSVNDTVVVFDRIRENFRSVHSGDEVSIANQSINQTMSRTIITSFTTLLSVVALAVFGGPILFGFAIALIVGIGIGTYSSIFVASALSLKLGLKRIDLIPKKIEDIDDMP